MYAQEQAEGPTQVTPNIDFTLENSISQQADSRPIHFWK